MKPKILIIDNSVAITGALKSISRSAYDLKQYFYFYFIIPKRSTGISWIEDKGFSTIYQLPLHEISKRVYSLLIYLPYLFINAIRLKRIIKQQHIDIIHVNDFYNLLPVMIRFFGNATPYICHVRFMPDRFPAWLLNFWIRIHFRFAFKIIVVSQSVKRLLPDHPKITLIYNELPVEERYSNTITSSEPKQYYSFLCLSNFMDGKGQFYVLQAFSRIASALPNWKLRFVGGDMGLEKNMRYHEHLMAEAYRLGIDKKVEWAGFTEDVEWEYKQADVVLNFSESESFSITCLEALYFGRPLIATDCGGPAEIIDHEVTGLLVPNRNITEMAKAMQRMALDESLRTQMGFVAREVVRKKFSLEKTSIRLKEEYDLLLAQKP